MLVAGALLAGLASLPAWHGASATPQPEAPADTPEGEETVSGLELVVAPEAPVLTEADTEAKFAVLLRNTSEATAPEGSIELALGERFTGQSASEAAAAGDSGEAESAEATAAPRTVIATSQIDAVRPGSEQRITVSVALKDISLFTAAAHGVYPLYATYAASDSSVANSLTAFAPVVWEGPEPTASVPVGVIVPLTLPASVQSMPSRAQLGEALPRLDALVDYAVTSHGVLAIDPRIIVAIRGYGTEAPRGAPELLARLESTGIPSFLLQFGDADPAAQAALEFESLLQPVGFEFITRFGAWEATEPEPTEGDGAATGDAAAGKAAGAPAGTEAGAAAATSATASTAAASTDSGGSTDTNPGTGGDTDAEPTDSAEPADPEPGEADPEQPAAAPTDAALSAWPHGLAGGWPAPGQADHRTIALLRGAGVDLTVLSSTNVRLTGGPRASLGDGSALVTDSELDAAVRLALTGASETDRALGEAQAAARLALAANAGVTGLVIGVDRAGAAEHDHPERVLSQLTAPRWVDAVAHTALPEGSAQLQPGSSSEERTELLRTAMLNEPAVREVRALLEQPEYLDSYQRMRLLTLFGTRLAAPDEDFAAAAKQFAKRDQELRDGVRLVDTKRAQLVGGSTRIPIQLRNSLPFDAKVTLEVAPTSAALNLPERSFTNIELPEDSSERVLVPANSRVSSGESALLLTVSSSDGEFTAATGRLDVSISTTVETVAIALLGSAAALLFGFGIWRSVRRRRALSPRE
ncbi:hypothetical protein GCM10020360_24200 [Nonlabens tegetincola]